MLKRMLVTGATITALAGGLLAAPGATATPAATTTTTSAAAYVAPSISWKKCKDDFLRSSKAQCGMLTVPLDHAVPTGPTIQLAVSRVRHTTKKYRGVLFTNPGGPGGAGINLAGLGQFVPGKVGRSYDWVGLDPRGVGESKPALSCDRKYAKVGRRPSDYEPSTPALLDAWLGYSETYAADCATSDAAALLPHVKTTDTVADFETLREALGEETVSFYGFSYGTYIAQVYATQHPDRIEKLVLDGVVNPTRVWYPANLDQDVAFEKAFGKFASWVARADRVFDLGTTGKQVQKRYYRLYDRLAKKPVRGIGGTELSDVALSAGYGTFAWPDVAAAISAADRGKIGPLRAAYLDGNPATKGSDNGFAMYLATQCADAPWPTDWPTWQADNDRVAKRHPFLTWGNAWFNAPCRTWSVPPSTPVQIVGADIPVLLINETYDAATPFSGALEVRRIFPGASLVEGVGGTTHSASLNGVKCVDNAIAAFLTDGTTPKRRSGNRSDKRCDPFPTPSPTAPDTRTLPQRPPLVR
jgi:pimeloyl-ACP methyl ester carboxylesterase